MNNNALFLENWTVLSVEQSTSAYTVAAIYDVAPEACPKCGTVGRFYRHGPKETKYVDAPVHGKHSKLVVAVQRYKCRECGATFLQSLPDMAPGRLMTQRCYNYIAEQSLRRPTLHVARDVGVDEKLCRIIQREHMAEVFADRAIVAPQVLGIDEVKLLGDTRAIFTDVLGRKVLDLIEGRSKTLVGQWLAWLPDRDRIQYVTIDMWDAYRDMAHAWLKGATVVVDKFHIIRKANWHLDRIRVAYARSLPKARQQKAALRGRLLLQKSRHRLTAKQSFILDGWLANAPTLKQAWDAKEAFYDIWDTESREEAVRRFAAWESAFGGVPEFGKLAATVHNWHDEIFAFFGTGLTNAYTEAANGILKISNRLGRGYSLDVIRARVLMRNVEREADVFVCECCKGLYPMAMGTVHAGHVWPHKTTGWAPNGIIMCPNCHARFYMENGFNHDGAST